MAWQSVMILPGGSYNELIERILPEDENMTEDKRTVRLTHSVTMNDRRNLSMTGVEEVIGCDEEQLTLKTSMGELTVDGNGLHIGSFNRSTGELKLDGVIRGIVYADAEPDKQGFFKRLFK